MRQPRNVFYLPFICSYLAPHWADVFAHVKDSGLFLGRLPWRSALIVIYGSGKGTKQPIKKYGEDIRDGRRVRVVRKDGDTHFKQNGLSTRRASEASEISTDITTTDRFGGRMVFYVKLIAICWGSFDGSVMELRQFRSFPRPYGFRDRWRICRH
jgi:hypothetical protein